MICLDTNTTIYSIQGVSSPDLEEAAAKIKRYLEYLGTQRTRVGLPAPVVAEFLAHPKIDDNSAANHLAILQKRFEILTFDLPSMAVAGRLLRKKAIIKDCKPEGTHGRQLVRVDAMIVAIAKAHGASAILTNDKGVHGLAAAIGLNALGIDDLKVPANLFNQGG